MSSNCQPLLSVALRFGYAFAKISMSYDVCSVLNTPSRKREVAARRACELENVEFLLGLYSALFQDLGLHFRDAAYLVKRTRSEGLAFLTSELPILAKAMERGLANGQFERPNSFKSSGQSSLIPAFLGGEFRKVFADDGVLRTDARPEAVLAIRQVCYLAYKAELPRKAALDKAVVDRFVKVEQELSTLEIEDDPLLRIASLLITSVTQDYSGVKKPKHGPGVSANVQIDQKDEAQLSPLPGVRKYPRHFFLNEKDGWDRLDRYPVWRTTDYFLKATRNVAKVILVPKDSRGPRLISAEPFENQFLQQGVASWLVDQCESHKLTRGRVNFTDQSINQKLAKEASASRSWSTLDLKDASDRVSMALVRKLFRNQRLIADIECLRSTHTTLPAIKDEKFYWKKNQPERIQLQKHAPMGSALCFPIMALSLWAICVATLIGAGVEDPIEKVHVYGDDIIVPSDFAVLCISSLERYSLLVNRDKSFINSRFAESCGFDAFDGVDVTPIRLHQCDISNTTDLMKERPAVLTALLAKANLLSLRFQRAATFLYRKVEHWLGPLPYGLPSSPYLCRWAPTGMEDYLPELNIVTEGLKWKKSIPKNGCDVYNPLGVDLLAWVIEPRKSKRTQSLYGALLGHLASSRANETLHRVRGRHGWSYSSSPQFVGEDAKAINFGYVTKPKQFSLRLRRIDNYGLSPIQPWTGNLL